MGTSISPTLANLFLAHLERNWQNLEFSPILYRRYVDDIFAVFKNEGDIEKFHRYLNNVHQNLKFTIESNRQNIAFLDVMIDKNSEYFTSTYRKKTFTGLLLNFKTMCPTNWKNTLVTGLLHRLFTVSKSWNCFHAECNKLKAILKKNNYPNEYIDKMIKTFLNKKFKKIT